MGGEKMGVGCPEYILLGLPPRRRGKVSGRRHKSLVPGITPAWAGKSLFCFTAAVPIQDHPRMGGEKLLTCERIDFRLGSPPRGRGKGFGGLHMSVFSRITPAWAGKSSRAPWAISPARDHPRMGGEKPKVLYPICINIGSPPRGRGKVVLNCECLTQLGITPAWAGKRCHQPA